MWWIAQLIPQWIPSEQVGVTCPTSCLQHENNAFPQVTIHLTPSRPVKNSSDKISKRSNNLVYLCHAKGKSLGKTKTESCSRPPAPTESTFLSLQHKDSHQTEFPCSNWILTFLLFWETMVIQLLTTLVTIKLEWPPLGSSCFCFSKPCWSYGSNTSSSGWWRTNKKKKKKEKIGSR